MRNFSFAAMLVLAWTTFAHGQATLDHEEFVGPFPSWANVKAEFGAAVTARPTTPPRCKRPSIPFNKSPTCSICRPVSIALLKA